MSCKKKLAFVVSVYNKNETLALTIDSLIDSIKDSVFYDSFQIVLVNDGSTDESLNMCQEIKDKYDKFDIVVINQKNSGVSVARNVGIIASNSEYICFLDADDIILKSYFQFLDVAFRKFPNDNVFVTGFLKVNSISSINDLASFSGIIEVEDDFFKSWCHKHFFCASSICCKRSFLADNDLFFPAGENSGEDQYVWFKIGEISRIIKTPDKCVFYYVGDENSLSAKPLPIIEPHIVLIDSFVKREGGDSYRNLRSKLFKNKIIECLACGYKNKALSILIGNFSFLFDLKFLLRFIMAFLLTNKYYEFVGVVKCIKGRVK